MLDQLLAANALLLLLRSLLWCLRLRRLAFLEHGHVVPNPVEIRAQRLASAFFNGYGMLQRGSTQQLIVSE